MEITIPVTDENGKYILRQHIGEGSYGDDELTLAAVLSDMSPVITFRERTYVVSIHDIAKAVAKAALESEREENDV